MGRTAAVSIISPIRLIVRGVIVVLDRIGGQHLCHDIALVAQDRRCIQCDRREFRSGIGLPPSSQLINVIVTVKSKEKITNGPVYWNQTAKEEEEGGKQVVVVQATH
jgi:hypothetical protein